MDVQKVTAEYRLTEWAQVIKAQQESGQSIKDFCQTAGISKNKYFYWQRKLRKIALAELAETEEVGKNIVPRRWIQFVPRQEQHIKGEFDIV